MDKPFEKEARRIVPSLPFGAGALMLPKRRRLIAGLIGWPFALTTAPSVATLLSEDRPPPYIPTPQQVVDRMLDIAGVTKHDYVIDLGCGDGRIVITAARRFGARGLGIEIDAQLVAHARGLARKAGVADRTRFDVQDALATNLAEATVLTLYLGPDLNEKLMPRILETMRPGARVVSHDFPLGLWQPERSDRFDVPEKNFGRGGESTVMLWIVPARIHGHWRAQIGSPGAARIEEFSIEQNFQRFDGVVHRKPRDAALTQTRIDGARIGFMLPADAGHPSPRQVDARIDGNVITGTLRMGMAADAETLPFTAMRIDSRPRLAR
jgi:SAM-dependent methyltransferase